MSKPILRATLLAAAIATAPLAIAATQQSTQPASSASPHMQVQRRSVLDELDLTTTQQDAIRAAMRENFEQMRPQIQSLQQRRQAFETTQPGASNYQATVDSLAQAEADFARARVQHEGALRAKIYGVLTAAQRTKLQNLIAQQQARLRAQQQSSSTNGSAPAASH